jgi:putative membrane protein
MKRISLFRSGIAALAAIMVSGTLAAQAPNLTDPEIASVAVTSNQIAVDMAKLAKTKSKNEEVIKFADLMIRDHQSTIDKAVALVKKLNVTPKVNDLSNKLNSDASAETKLLESKSGDDFNKAYINEEVAYHQEVLNTIQKVLIPQTKNAELKALLQNAVPVVETHLEHAKMLQKTL